MSRARSEEPEFGSDSFLDVIANIVGILIILIVVAGVKVSRAPVLPRAKPPIARAEPIPEATHVDVPIAVAIAADEPPPVVMAVPAPAPVVEEPLPALPPPVASEELRGRAAAIEQALTESAAARAAVEEASRQLSAQIAAVRTQLRSVAAEAERETAAADRDQQQLASLREDVDDTRSKLGRLTQAIEESARKAPEAEVIEHRVNPIGRIVQGQELHFRLSGNRVAPVPVSDLANRLASEIQRKKELMVKMQRYEGTVGPIDGFSMQYVIERARMSLAEEIKFGGAMVRMQVSRWTLVPEPDLRSESASEATERGSQFYHALLAAGPTATLTFWVYPDSFEACTELQQFARRHGYEVATRPLPPGVPITGSPDGSKSVAQ